MIFFIQLQIQMNIKLYLDKPDSDESVIMLYVSFNGMYVRLSTGLKIKKTNCVIEGKTRLVKIKSSFMYSKEYNAEINRIVSYINSYIVSNNNKGLLTKGKFVQDYKNYISPYSEIDIGDTIKLLTEYHYIRENYSNGVKRLQPLSQKTSSRIKSIVNNLISFIKAYPKYKNFSRFNDMRIVSDYTEWLYNINNSLCVVSGKLNFVKQFIRWVVEEKKYNDKVNIKFNYITENDNLSSFALNENDLKLLKTVKLDSKMLDYYRNWFLVQCYTGLRYSDLIRLNKENIKIDERIIWLKTKKTNNVIQIPIVDELLDILTTKGDLLFNTNSTSYNSYLIGIKKVAKIIGLNEMLPKITYVKGVKVMKTMPRYKLIGTHTARRTFITLAIKKRIPDRVIMQVSGHSSYKSFNKYVKLANEDVKKEFFEAFNNKDVGVE